MKHCVPTLPVLAGALLCAFTGSTARSIHETDPTQKTVNQLIGQLGSDKFDLREEATRHLMNREEAVPALRQALKSSDPEVARRASEILDAFSERKSRRFLDRLVALGKNGEADQLSEYFVRLPEKVDEERGWQVVTQLAKALVDLDRKCFHKTHLELTEGIPAGDFWSYKAAVRPQRIASTQPLVRVRDRGVYTIRAKAISIEESIGRSILVSAGLVRAPVLHGTVILAAGSVEVDGIQYSVVICDGDFTARRGLENCIVVARGVVNCPNGFRNCLIATASSVHAPKDDRVSNSAVREGETTPLGFVKFFDLGQAGLAIAPGEEGVGVKEVPVNERFARAGLRAGDVITAVDGILVQSPDAFRRLLRLKFAEGGEAIFTVRRADNSLNIPVPCKD